MELIEPAQSLRPLIVTGLAIPVLLVLVLRLRVPAFAALIGVALAAALAAGMPADDAYATITSGMGGTLGFIAVIVGLGALFGALLEAGGGLPNLANAVIGRSGVRGSQTAIGVVGLIVAIPVFFDVALIILAPVALALARRAGKPVMAYGLPLLAGLAIAHAFIPPTPGPVAVAEIIQADLAWVILAGLVTGVPALILAGPMFATVLERIGQMPTGLDLLKPEETGPGPTMPAGQVLWLILLPLILILGRAVVGVTDASGWVVDGLNLIGHPFGALLLACALTAFFAVRAGPTSRDRINLAIARALEPAGAVILVTGAGGAFKQVLVDTGAGAQLAQLALTLGLTPLLAGYFLALLVRVAQGSATVAMITAAGMTAPLMSGLDMSGLERAFVVVAIAAGASALSHVNDSGFWLVSRVFRLTEAETLRSWTIATLALSLTGLAVSLVAVLVV